MAWLAAERREKRGEQAGAGAYPGGASRLTSADLLWAGLPAFVVLSIAFLLPIHWNDYGWYLRVGGEIVRSGAIPAVDGLSSTQAGEPVIYQAWLAALSFWGLNALGGATATVLARGLLIAAFCALLWFSCREAGAGPRAAGALALLATLAGSNNWAVRPQLFAYPLFAACLWSLLRWQRASPTEPGERACATAGGGHGAAAAWLLPALALPWANLHGSFVLLFVLAGAALVAGKGERRVLLKAALAAGAATLVNPYGPRVWEYAFGVASNPSVRAFSSEWQPLAIAGWQSWLFFAWLLAFALAAHLSPRRLGVMEWTWFFAFGGLLLAGVRHAIWFLAILACLSAGLLGALWARWDRPPATIRPSANAALLAILLALSLACLPGVRQRWWPAGPPVFAPDTPVEAAAWLKSHPRLPGRLWADLTFSSYLVYALPERPVWIDTRFELYPPAQWERYLAIAEAAPGWEQALEKEGISLVMASVGRQPRLVAALEGSPAWREEYADGLAAIFSRRAPAGEPTAPDAGGGEE